LPGDFITLKVKASNILGTSNFITNKLNAVCKGPPLTPSPVRIGRNTTVDTLEIVWDPSNVYMSGFDQITS
jgi:hypothetical protein